MLHRSACLALAFALALALPAVAACGDNHDSADAQASGDGQHGSGSDDAHGATGSTAAIVAGDFGAGDPGVLATLDSHALTVTQGRAPAGAIGDDPTLRHFGNDVFVVNRADGNNVTLLDDHTFAVVAQVATGASSNPQDVALAHGKLYVPVYGGKGVAVVAPGSATIGIVDLSADDPDGHPQCESALAVDNEIYVACQLLDDSTFAPRGFGKVYVIDPTTDTVRTRFDLTTKNPITLLEPVAGGTIAVGTVDFSDGSGCIEQITPGPTPTSTCLVTNTVLGGYATRLQFADASTAWLAVSGTTFPNPPQTLALFVAGSPSVQVLSGAGEAISDVALCPDGTLVVADVTKNAAGVRAFSSSAERTTAALAIGLPPAAQHGLECY